MENHKIYVLDKMTAELIAAGEVVERPASVVKELLENAIDAGAKNITVEIENGGVTLIKISDDGSGIDRDDVPTAFLRHATSKVRTVDDLDRIGTLGFRGEALASVSAVAKVELFTCTETDEDATHYIIEGGEEISSTIGAHPKGTTIFVRDLFYNVPARLKFLKRDVSEGNAVAKIVDFIALSNPDIAIKFICDGKEEINTSGNGDLKTIIYEVLGGSFSKTLLKTDYTLEGVRVHGYISRPEESRGNRSMQIFFINGRYVRSSTALAALTQAYRGQVMTRKFPACVLNIEIPLEAVDVNVHPAKTEVRLVNEKPLFSAIYYGVKSTLAESGKHGEIKLKKPDDLSFLDKDFDENKAKSVQQTFQRGEKEPTFLRTHKKDIASFKESGSGAAYSSDGSSPVIFHEVWKETETPQKSEWIDTRETILENMPASKGNVNIDIPYVEIKEEKVIISDEVSEPLITIIGEAFDTYIIVQMDDSIYLIDKHAAHERILFEELKKEHEIDAQMLLAPVSVNLNRDEYEAIIPQLDNLKKAGYEIDDFGGSSVIVRALPMMLESFDTKSLIEEIAGGFIRGDKEKKLYTNKLEWIFHSTACRAAIKAGDKMPPPEMLDMAKKVLLSRNVMTCPHGRPVCYELSKKEIEKQFGRIQ